MYVHLHLPCDESVAEIANDHLTDVAFDQSSFNELTP